MARLKLLEGAQAVWMLMLAVNKKESCRTNIQLSSEISTRSQWDQKGPWQHIDTQIIVLASQSAVCVCRSLGRNSRDLSSKECGKPTQSEQTLRSYPARLA